MKAVKSLMKSVKFSNKIEFIWFELWLHEGRCVCHDASMMGLDITHWYGIYEIARNSYTHLIPELEHLIEKGMASYNEEKQALNLSYLWLD